MPCIHIAYYCCCSALYFKNGRILYNFFFTYTVCIIYVECKPVTSKVELYSTAYISTSFCAFFFYIRACFWCGGPYCNHTYTSGHIQSCPIVVWKRVAEPHSMQDKYVRKCSTAHICKQPLRISSQALHFNTVQTILLYFSVIPPSIYYIMCIMCSATTTTTNARPCIRGVCMTMAVPFLYLK